MRVFYTMFSGRFFLTMKLILEYKSDYLTNDLVNMPVRFVLNGMNYKPNTHVRI